MTRFVLVLGALALLGGCASQPISHYSLLPAASPAVLAAEKPAFAAMLVDIQPIGLPALTDRQELVVRQGERFVILDNQRWAVPLSDEMRSALGLLMQRRLGTRDVTGLVPPVGASVLRVKVMVRQFEVVPGQYTLVDADWNLSRSDRPEATRQLCHTRKAIAWQGAGANEALPLVQAYQGAFDALAGEIAGAAQRWVANGGDVCPAATE